MTDKTFFAQRMSWLQKIEHIEGVPIVTFVSKLVAFWKRFEPILWKKKLFFSTTMSPHNFGEDSWVFYFFVLVSLCIGHFQKWLGWKLNLSTASQRSELSLSGRNAHDPPVQSLGCEDANWTNFCSKVHRERQKQPFQVKARFSFWRSLVNFRQCKIWESQ